MQMYIYGGAVPLVLILCAIGIFALAEAGTKIIMNYRKRSNKN